MTGLLIDAREEIWPLKEVFRISRGSRTEARVVVATISDGEHIRARRMCADRALQSEHRFGVGADRID